MNTLFAGIIGGWELVLILAVVLMLFGAKKLPELARGLGSGIKEFKKATRDVTDDLQRAIEEDVPPPAPPKRIPPPNVEQAAHPATPAGSSAETKA
jgi:sec-independent protein translocase protein TatA